MKASKQQFHANQSAYNFQYNYIIPSITHVRGQVLII